MATKIKKTITKKPTTPSKGELNRGQGTGSVAVGKGVSRADAQKQYKKKLANETVLRYATFGYDALVSDAVKKAKAKKAAKK